MRKRSQRKLDAPAHVREWLTRQTRSFGPDRFARMLELHIYINLCLKARYAGRLKGKLKKLENALGDFFSDDQSDPDAPIHMAQRIEKERKEMNRRLKKCEAADCS